MLGRSPKDDPIDEETCEELYRLPEIGEGEPVAHPVSKITRQQIHVEKAPADDNAADHGSSGHWQLSRRELERRGYTYNGAAEAYFYRSREESKGR